MLGHRVITNLSYSDLCRAVRRGLCSATQGESSELQQRPCAVVPRPFFARVFDDFASRVIIAAAPFTLNGETPHLAGKLVQWRARAGRTVRPTSSCTRTWPARGMAPDILPDGRGMPNGSAPRQLGLADNAVEVYAAQVAGRWNGWMRRGGARLGRLPTWQLSSLNPTTSRIITSNGDRYTC